MPRKAISKHFRRAKRRGESSQRYFAFKREMKTELPSVITSDDQVNFPSLDINRDINEENSEAPQDFVPPSDHNYASSQPSQGNVSTSSYVCVTSYDSETESHVARVALEVENRSDINAETSQRSDHQHEMDHTPKKHGPLLSPNTSQINLVVGTTLDASSALPVSHSLVAWDAVALNVELTDSQYYVEQQRGTPAVSYQLKSVQRDEAEEDVTIESLLQKVGKIVAPILPPHWISVLKDGGVHVGLMARTDVLIIQRSIFTLPTGIMKVHVHGKRLPQHHEMFPRVDAVQLCKETVKQFSKNIVKAAFSLRSYEVCLGIQDFQSTWHLASGSIVDENSFKENRYKRTLRSSKCLLLVSNLSMKRCRECKHVWRYLSVRVKRESQQSSGIASDRKPHKYLTPQETENRLKENSKTIKNLRVANERLKSKVSSLTNGDDVKPENFDEYFDL